MEDEDGTTLVLDEEGQVEVRHTLRAGDPKVLNPGEYIRVYVGNEPIARKTIDKGGVLQRALRVASEVLYEAAARSMAARLAEGLPARVEWSEPSRGSEEWQSAASGHHPRRLRRPATDLR